MLSTLAETFSIESLVRVVVTLCVLGGICWLLYWLVGFIGIPDPFAKVARAIIAVFAVLCLISMLLDFAGHPVVRW